MLVSVPELASLCYQFPLPPHTPPRQARTGAEKKHRKLQVLYHVGGRKLDIITETGKDLFYWQSDTLFYTYIHHLNCFMHLSYY